MKNKILLFVICLMSTWSLIAQNNIGIGNTNPQFRLDLSGRMGLRGGTDYNNSAGLWLSGSGTDSAVRKLFMGMRADSIAGFYSEKSNVGWGFLFDGRNGNVGIGNPDASYPLSFKDLNGDKISLFKDLNGNYYGLGIGNSVMQLMTPNNASDIVFGYGNSSSFTENMRIKGNGNVGVGVSNPLLGGLVVNKKVGSTNAVFGSNTAGVAIESTLPGIGFNTYDDDFSRKAIASGYGGYMGVNPSTGEMILSITNASFPAGSSVSSNLGISITSNGNTGVGVTADPIYKMDVGGRMRLRSTPGLSAGHWLNNNSNSATPAFIGMQTDNKVGFYGTGIGWGLTMNTQNGALSVAGSTGNTGQILTSKGDAASPEWKTAGNIIRTEFSGFLTSYYSLTGTDSKELTGSAYNVTLTSPSRIILYNKTQTIGVCPLISCDTRWRLEVRLNGSLARTYRINGAKNGDLGYLANAIDLTTGPEYFDLPAGTHLFTFFGVNLIGISDVALQVTSMIIPL